MLDCVFRINNRPYPHYLRILLRFFGYILTFDAVRCCSLRYNRFCYFRFIHTVDYKFFLWFYCEKLRILLYYRLFLVIINSRAATTAYINAARIHNITVLHITSERLNTCPPYIIR